MLNFSTISVVLLCVILACHINHISSYIHGSNHINAIRSKLSTQYAKQPITDDFDDSSDTNKKLVKEEPMFSISYDPLEAPNQVTLERDLEDNLLDSALRFYDEKVVGKRREMVYLVGLEDLSERDVSDFTLEESLIELSELSGAAGLKVVGSTYQRVQKPSIEYYIGQGKTKDILKSIQRLDCYCVIFDTELSPSQQKNLELAFNREKTRDVKKQVKILDRTALILDIFAQHARSKEGQLQVQLALLTYRLPRLTNMWSHLERQAAGAKGKKYICTYSP